MADAYVRQNGKRTCRPCQLRRSRKWYEGKRPGDGIAAIVSVSGVSPKIQRVWATRRRRFGDSGMSERCLSHIRRIASSSAQKRRSQTHCRRGHKLSGANLYVNPGSQARQCRTCRGLLARGRPSFVEGPDRCRISIVAHDAFYRRERQKRREAMIAAHPDKHPGRKVGTGPFIRARQALQAFVEAERAWYAQYGLKVPSEEKRTREEAA